MATGTLFDEVLTQYRNTVPTPAGHIVTQKKQEAAGMKIRLLLQVYY